MIRSIILLVFGGLVVWLAIRSLRAQRLKERYVLLLIFVGLPFVLLAFWPDAIVTISEKLQIEKPTVLVLALAAYVVLVNFELLSIVSVQERKIAALTQIVALMTKQVNDQGKKKEEKPSDPG